MKSSKQLIVVYWIVTVLFALQMSFTAYAQLRIPEVSQAFVRLGFPAYFRVELSWAKFAGVIALLLPMVPARVKEWAYAGFAFTLASALIAHLSIGEGPAAWGWAAGTAVLWAFSYVSWRRLQTTPTLPELRTSHARLSTRGKRDIQENLAMNSTSASATRVD